MNEKIEITREDVEQYIEYAKLLHEEILRHFARPSVELKDMDIVDKIAGAIPGMLSASAVDMVFRQVFDDFFTWLTHDCLFTEHKAKFPVTGHTAVNSYRGSNLKGE